MRTSMLSLLGFVLLACGTTSYGVVSDGVFPGRPAGADYPNWEHMCVVVTQSNTTQTLNDSGSQGWEFVAMGPQGSNQIMCFKRPVELQAAK